MKLTDLFIRRPVLAIVVNLVILIAGLQSIRSLSVRQYPRSDIAVVQVTTAYIGANADLVRGFITTPLERVIASADGIDYIESSSAQGLSTILVHLKLNYDTNAALTQVQAKVAQVRNDLPPEAEDISLVQSFLVNFGFSVLAGVLAWLLTFRLGESLKHMSRRWHFALLLAVFGVVFIGLFTFERPCRGASIIPRRFLCT